MEVNFADTFSKSLKRLSWHESRIYKTYSFFRYDISRFIGNVWRFRKALANHYWWDHHATLSFVEIGLSHMADNLETKGLEVDGPRLKKVAKIRRAVELISNYNDDNYIEMAEAELGEIVHHEWEFEDVPDKPGYSRLIDKDTEEEKVHNRKVYDRSTEIANSEWNELWTIIRGQDYEEYSAIYKSLNEEEKKEEDHHNKWFDGTGMRGWWD
jgi:hypothetical protein